VVYEMPMMGTEGPHSDCRGYGLTIAAAGGLLGLTGYADGPPVGTGTNYPDHVPNPLPAPWQFLAALRKRRRGRGEYIELAQLDRPSTRSALRSSPRGRRGRRPDGQRRSRRHTPGVYPAPVPTTVRDRGSFSASKWAPRTVLEAVAWADRSELGTVEGRRRRGRC
jgi:benzylsuccinate CoA-transferase BbsF subunit